MSIRFTDQGRDLSGIAFSDVQNAAERIKPFIHRTPIVSSTRLNHWLGHTILFKAECLQKVGAFKARGGCNAVAFAKQQLPQLTNVVANSSGNHAQAVAWAASQFGLASTLFMPANVSQVKVQATTSYGARIVLKETRAEVDRSAELAANRQDVLWIPPYNDRQVIAGQGTAALEGLQECSDLDALFLPCGGGGLLSGSLIVARHLSPQTHVIGVEPLNANDAAESRRKGCIQSLDGTPDTLADGARTPSVGSLTFPYIQQADDFFEADENSIVYWTQWLTHLLKLTIEPTSAMSLFGVCQWLKKQTSKKTVMVILSGGNLDTESRKLIWQNDCLSQIPRLEN